MKTIEEMKKNAEYSDEMREKLASLQTALDAEDPAEFVKIASTISQEDYGKLNPAVLTKISGMLAKANQLKKTAEDGPGNPSGLAPSEKDIPKEEKPVIEDGSLPEGKTDPQIDLKGGENIEQAPGTSPVEEGTPTDVSSEVSDSTKTAFVLQCIGNGINKAQNALIRKTAQKRSARLAGERRAKTAEAMVQDLIDEYGEENVASILKEAAAKGTQNAINVLNGGTNG